MQISELHLYMGLAALGWASMLFVLVLFMRRGTAASGLHQDISTLNQELTTARERIIGQAARAEQADGLEAMLAVSQGEISNLQRQEASLLTRIEEREKHVRDQRSQLEDEFRTMAARLVREAGDNLKRDATQTFEKQQLTARQDAEKYSRSVSDLLKPMRETLTRYEEGLREMRDNQKIAHGELTGQITSLAQSANAVQAEARALSTALTAGPKTRGSWGETTLKNVVEMAGMSPYCDFDEQYSVLDEDQRRKQPDLIVRLPSERMVVIDSKVSLNDWLDAAEAENDQDHRAAINQHGKCVWTHVQALSAKDYAGALKKEGAIDFVVMFMPGETFFTAAIDARPTLFQDAYEKGVLIATPTTLIAILKSIAHSWRQQKANQNAYAVSNMAAELYDSLRKTGDHFAKLGKSLDTTTKHFNALIGNMETRVLPRARKLSDYEMPGTEKPIVNLALTTEEAQDPSARKGFVIASQLSLEATKDQAAEEPPAAVTTANQDTSATP